MHIHPRKPSSSSASLLGTAFKQCFRVKSDRLHECCVTHLRKLC